MRKEDKSKDLKEEKAEVARSHSHYRLLFEYVPDGILIADAESNYLDANPMMCKMLGYSRDELIGLHASDIVSQQEIKNIDPALSQIKARDDYFRVWQFQRKDGTLFPAEVRVTTMPEGNLLAVVRDISEQIKAKERQQYQTMLLQSISDAIITTDLNFVIQSWNDAAEVLYGWRAEEVIGKNMREVIPSGLSGDERERLIDRFNAEGSWKGETIQQHKDGHDILVFASVNLIRDEDGRPLTVLAIAHDITKRKRTEIALQESEEKLQLFIEHAPAALAMFDRNMCYLASSRRWLADYGLDEQDIIGHSHYEIFPEIPDRWRAIHRRALQGEVVRADEDAFERLNGTTQWLRWEVRPWYTVQQTIGGIVVFSEDITETKRAKEALQQSETRYRAIVEDQTELIVRFKADGTILFANEAYARVFGGTSESLIGQIIWSLLEEYVAENLRNKIDKLTPENPAGVNEHRLVLPNGRVRWLRWIDRGIYASDGRLLEVQAVGYDITERHQAEEQLRQSKTQLQQIVFAVPEGVLLLSADNTVELTNPVADQYLAVLTPVYENGRLVQLGNRPLSELLVSPPKGLWHEITFADHIFEAIARLVEADMENSGWVLVLHDATQENDFQQHLQQQERLAAVGQLASGIAHDFNNIIAVIVLYSQLILRSAELQQKTREKLVTIEKQAKRASDLIQQILDFSRQSVMEKKYLDLLPFVKEFVKLLERTLPEHIWIELVHPDEAFLIEGDPSRIQQVLMNLSVNARDAMPEGGRLTISLANIHTNKDSLPVPEMTAGDWVRIQVTDNGSGIPKELLSKIFEPFFTTKEVGQGTGLGLAQVYGIMEQHEGYIDVSSRQGRGTTFSLYFPSLDALEDNDLPYNRASLYHGAGQTILLVEDNEATRQALVSSLVFLDYKVIEVTNGREALQFLSTHASDIDLIVSDVVMPEIGGIALFHAIRQQELTIPLILLSGHPLGEELEKLQAIGLAGWLLKPPELDILSQLLAQALKGNDNQ